MKFEQDKLARKLLVGTLFVMLLAGCGDNISQYQKPVNKDDPTGMGLTKAKRTQMINDDPNMTPDQKAAALQRLQNGRHIMGRQVPQ